MTRQVLEVDELATPSSEDAPASPAPTPVVVKRPPLTTVEQPIQLMGQRAIEMLVAILDGAQPDARQVRLPTRLVVRDTTAGPR